jgi:hypothetical protein
MKRMLTVMLMPSMLGGCGLAGTSGAAATAGAAAAEQAGEARDTLDRVESDIEAAQQAAAEARRAAEADAQ